MKGLVFKVVFSLSLSLSHANVFICVLSVVCGLSGKVSNVCLCLSVCLSLSLCDIGVYALHCFLIQMK